MGWRLPCSVDRQVTLRKNRNSLVWVRLFVDELVLQRHPALNPAGVVYNIVLEETGPKLGCLPLEVR
ncbi:hypothetical protein KOR34_14870 [Posidoniimonas corsicana]|uniref:Uncharacterized protein n=1 Tax=Posidoniimonas corsicana TaxID=1938618 RepID=A0A5C5VEJ9_9BACT|nr:hypothetical protein KOR34_14870 [Posidoniimonas corsicana]